MTNRDLGKNYLQQANETGIPATELYTEYDAKEALADARLVVKLAGD